jgi:Flp pilus assembly protein TadG
MRRRLEQGGAAMFARIFIPLKLRRATARFLNDQSGAVLALVAIVIIPVLIGGAALSIDLGFAFSRQRQMQVAADAAAYSGAASLVQNAVGKTLGTTYYATEAINTAAAAGFTDGVNNIHVFPSYDAAAGTVTVAISEQRNWALAGVFLPSAAFTSSVQAVAHVANPNDFCIVALCSSGSTGVTFKGSATLNSNNNCGITSDCKTSCSVDSRGGANLNIAVPVYTPGGYCESGTANVNVTQNAYSVPDPFASFKSTMPTNWPLAVTQTLPNSSNSYPKTVDPGVYKDFNPNGNVTLNPGTYYVNGDFTLNAGVTIAGDNVTIIVYNSGNKSSITVNGGSIWNLDANTLPANGVALAGYGTNTVKFNGSATSTGRGAFYFPQAEIDFTGNSSTATMCLQIVANAVQLSGNSNLNDGCASSGNQVVNYKIRLIK